MVVGLCYDRFVVSAAVGCSNEGAMVSAKSTATAAWVLTTGAWNDDARRYECHRERDNGAVGADPGPTCGGLVGLRSASARRWCAEGRWIGMVNCEHCLAMDCAKGWRTNH